MKSILLGHERGSRREVRLSKSSFSTHYHLIGGTGKGKTTAIHTLLHPLLRDPTDRSCVIIVDRLGNLSEELLFWMASPEFCTDDVRCRLVYIQPSREDTVMAFNPLLYDTPAHGYYKVERATEIILRAWESMNIEAMPRLARWTFNSFWAAAQLGLTIADCSHLLMPGSQYHKPLLNALPARLQAEWSEISQSKSAEAMRILDSSRNRLKPYFESDILRRMFGTTQNRMNVRDFMEQGKIVVIDLAPRNRLAGQLANTIGGLILNEVIATARNLPRGVRFPTYLFLDEFQNFVGPDIEEALPEVRQLGLKLILSHQSFSQLERGDYDLSSLIFQAQSRMIFGVQGEDADILAHELASINFDPRRVKDEFYSRRQLISGHKKVALSSWSDSNSHSAQWQESYGSNWSRKTNEVLPPDVYRPSVGTGQTFGNNSASSNGGGTSATSSTGGHESLVPQYDEFNELSNRTYVSFDEQKSEWAQGIRKLKTGECLVRLVDDHEIRQTKVKRTVPGYLNFDMQTLQSKLPQIVDNVERLIEENFASDLFITAESVDRESHVRLEKVLNPPILISESTQSANAPFA